MKTTPVPRLRLDWDDLTRVFVSLSFLLSRAVMLAQSTDSGQLIAAAVIKLFHAMKLQVQDLRGVGIQVQLLEGNNSVPNNSNSLRTRSIKDMLGLGPSRGLLRAFVSVLGSVRILFINSDTFISMLQMLPTPRSFRESLLLSRLRHLAPVLILFPPPSRCQERAKSHSHADKRRQSRERTSTSASKSPPLPR